MTEATKLREIANTGFCDKDGYSEIGLRLLRAAEEIDKMEQKISKAIDDLELIKRLDGAAGRTPNFAGKLSKIASLTDGITQIVAQLKH